MTRNLMIVEDEEAICWGLQKVGQELGCQVHIAANSQEAIAIARTQPLDVVITDVRLPGQSGLEALSQYRADIGNIPVIVITAYGDLQTAVTAVRQGAFEYLVKPFDAALVRHALTRALAVAPRPEPESPTTTQATAVEGFIAETPIMQQVFNRIALAAASEASVLIGGESGTGKELAARAIHKFSPRSAGPFITVNLAAVSPSLAESELFGHVKGAYTGAEQSRRGLLAEASGGTLFLDEVADIPLSIQVKLLRALEQQEITPVGSDQVIKTDFRVIAATHRNLTELIHQSAFRHDLFFRLSAFQIKLPPLRERQADIEPLAQHFLNLLTQSAATPPILTPAARREMHQRPWWGNVRELRNVMQHAIIVSRGNAIDSSHLPPPIPSQVMGLDETSIEDKIRELLAQWASDKTSLVNPANEANGHLHEQLLALVEPPVFQQVLQANQGQYVAAARVLGLHRTTLKRKIDDYELEPQ